MHTTLIRDLDPEAAQQLLDPALQRMMDAMHRFEGTVNQVLGDGVMALFGAPIAHEDHALRACYAALAMQAELRRYAEAVHALGRVPSASACPHKVGAGWATRGKTAMGWFEGFTRRVMVDVLSGMNAGASRRFW